VADLQQKRILARLFVRPFTCSIHNWYHKGARKARFEVNSCGDAYGESESRAGFALAKERLDTVENRSLSLGL
jgi:hypothetical protein